MVSNLANGVFQPHLRIQRRGKAVQEPGIRLEGEVSPGIQNITEIQRQPDSPARQYQPVSSLNQWWVMGDEFGSLGGKLRPERQGFFQVTPGQGKPLHRHKVQNGRIIFRPAVEPLGPGGQEVQPGTKAGFRNHKMPVGGQGSKALPEQVATDEYIAGLFQPVVATEVHITKAGRFRHAIAPDKIRRLHGRRQNRVGHRVSLRQQPGLPAR